MKVNLIDPNNPDSLGLNPFIYDDPTKIAIIISSVIRGMYKSMALDTDEVYKENAAVQAVENLSILLKEMYPRLSNGLLPNLEDMLKMLNDFDLAEVMCRKMMEEPDLAEQYGIQISYFKKNFFRASSGRKDTEKYVYAAITQLDNLLRYPGIKNILCNRTNNINFDKALANGEITLVCTRRGDLGATAHRAFGLFFLLLMQYSVLTRPGNEKTRIPHFLYVDEFPEFMCRATAPIFTLYRKYRVGSVISAQGLSQFGAPGKDNYRQVILGNCSTKIVFGGNTPEENKWWEEEFGKHREWQWSDSYNTEKGEYDAKLSNIKWGWKEYFNYNKLSKMGFKAIAYKTRNNKGKVVIGEGKVDFLESKYKEKQEEKNFNFYRFTSGIHDESKKSILKNSQKTSFKVDHDNDEEFDPIQTDNTDANYFLNSEDGITFDLKKGNSN